MSVNTEREKRHIDYSACNVGKIFKCLTRTKKQNKKIWHFPFNLQINNNSVATPFDFTVNSDRIFVCLRLLLKLKTKSS